MQLAWLQTFMAVYHTGSFTKAARQLGVTQPTVTQQIRSLESEFGRPLFDRTTRGAIATPSATVLAQDVQHSMTELNAAVDRHFGTHEESRPLRIGATAELTAARVMPSLAHLVAGETDVRMSVGVSHDLLEQLGEGFLDLVVSTIRPRKRGLEVAPLADEELVLVASPEVARSLSFAGEEPDEGALNKVPLIAYADTLPLVRQYWRMVFEREPTGHVGAVIPDLRAILAAVASSAGISVLPRCLCSVALASGTLVTLLEPEIPPINTLYLAVRSGTLSDHRLSQVHGQLLRNAQNWN